MKKLTVFDFCSQIGAASDEIPVVVRVGLQEIGHFRSLYQIPAVAMPGILEAKVTFVTVKCTQIENRKEKISMFYVLDFHSHRFTTCETVEEVNEKLKQLQDSGVAEDEISVINRLVDDCEMSINAYRDFARSYC